MNGIAGIVGDLGQRFRLVDLLPTSILVVSVGTLIAAGAPGETPTVANVLDKAEDLTLAESALLVLLVLVGSVLFVPFTVPLVRLFEGYWGSSRLARGLGGFRVDRHQRKRASLKARTRAQSRDGVLPDPKPALEAGWDLVRRYPPTALVMPTALGNALRAAEVRAGRPYGLDAIIVWPRLYILLDAEVRALVDDRRQQLDVMVRFATVFAIGAVVTLALLATSGPWLLVPVAAVLLAWISYRAAVAAAIAYGEALDTAFDLNHFVLGDKLGLPRPGSAAEERSRNEAVTVFWSRLRLPGDLAYAPDPSGDEAGGQADHRVSVVETADGEESGTRPDPEVAPPRHTRA